MACEHEGGLSKEIERVKKQLERTSCLSDEVIRLSKEIERLKKDLGSERRKRVNLVDLTQRLQVELVQVGRERVRAQAILDALSNRVVDDESAERD